MIDYNFLRDFEINNEKVYYKSKLLKKLEKLI